MWNNCSICKVCIELPDKQMWTVLLRLLCTQCSTLQWWAGTGESCALAVTHTPTYRGCLWQQGLWRSRWVWGRCGCPSGLRPGCCSTPTSSAAAPAASRSCPAEWQPAAQEQSGAGEISACLGAWTQQFPVQSQPQQSAHLQGATTQNQK